MKTKLIIIGGFLGAGKTTLLSAVAHIVKQEGKSVGLITNDQAKGLVDTHVLSANGMPVQEIAGSCFCCDFDGLMEAALYLKDTAHCDIILAEPVGSCTDLSATLLQPIKSYYKRYFDLTPLTILIDPAKLQEILASEENTKAGSGYIYLKQLEEADYLVVNKIDVLNEKQQNTIRLFLEGKFPDYPVKFISALQNIGLKSWLEDLQNDKKSGTRIAQVDYYIYAEGEAEMGWYNAKFFVYHKEGKLIPWADFNVRLLELLQAVFQNENIAIGHMKTFLKSGTSELQANLTGTKHELSLKGTPFSNVSANIIVNIRAETSSGTLKDIMDDVISVCSEEGIQFEIQILNHLTLGKPMPTHRFAEQV
ncbi:GTP-binding protein [Aureibaculum conchae]|uniref:GTP-binding protein n=1 Tax=Aureibaculum sp. 2308TA14-22 TaxID=3108392 RepID=UPI0033927554